MIEERPHRLRIRQTYDTTYFSENSEFCFELKKAHHQPIVFHKKTLLQILTQDPDDPAFLMVILKDDFDNIINVVFLDADIELLEEDLDTEQKTFYQDDVEKICIYIAEHINTSGEFESNVHASPLRIFHYEDECSVLFARDKSTNQCYEFVFSTNKDNYGLRGPMELN